MVIQRWQSLFILVSTVLMCIFAFVPLAQIQTVDSIYQLTASGLQTLGTPDSMNVQLDSQISAPIHIWGILGLNILIVIFSFITIFQYKKMKMQMKMCLINITLTIVLLISITIIGTSVCKVLDGASFIPSINYSLAICAVILDILAYSFIKKDLKILRSYDRIR